jgi:hypothetical protein
VKNSAHHNYFYYYYYHYCHHHNSTTVTAASTTAITANAATNPSATNNTQLQILKHVKCIYMYIYMYIYPSKTLYFNMWMLNKHPDNVKIPYNIWLNVFVSCTYVYAHLKFRVLHAVGSAKNTSCTCPICPSVASFQPPLENRQPPDLSQRFEVNLEDGTTSVSLPYWSLHPRFRPNLALSPSTLPPLACLTWALLTGLSLRSFSNPPNPGAFSSLGWKPLGSYHLSLDHQGIGKTGITLKNLGRPRS